LVSSSAIHHLSAKEERVARGKLEKKLGAMWVQTFGSGR
jgi:hypothetical protein